MSPQETKALLDNLIGKDKMVVARMCKQSGMKPRMMREDKTMFMGTSDLNFERINLEYDNGICTNAYIG